MDSSGIIKSAADSFSLEYNREFTDFQTIAEGNFSCIVRARRYNQWWALKCMKPAYAKQTFFQQMLQKEYDLLIRLHHSGIDRPISIEQVEGLGVCLVMEYIAGVTLGEFCTNRVGRRRLAFQIVETMAYVHSCQIVHRDLKPANIMVTQNGQNVKIIDFGLADADNYAFLKQAAGTPKYISPEQQAGGSPDVRNDVYSLGVILQEMQLGWAFRHLIKRSTGPIERRYMGAGELLRAMRRAERLPAISWVAAIIGLTALGIGLLQTCRPYPAEVSLPRSQESESTVCDTAAPTTPQRIVPETVIRLEPDSSHRDATSLDHLPQGKEEGRSAIRTDSEGGIPAPSPSSEAAAIPASPRAAGPVQTSGPKADNRFGEAFKAATKRVDKYMVDHNYDQFLTTLQNEPAPSRPLRQDPRMKEIDEQNKEFCAGLWT